jgi:hypothetical protein
VKEARMAYRISRGFAVRSSLPQRRWAWTTWETVAKFKTVEALERFATKHRLVTFGIF